MSGNAIKKMYSRKKQKTMKYYSTNHNTQPVTLEEAVTTGLAPDRGLYMPEQIKQLPESFFQNIQDMTFRQIACCVAENLFGEDIDHDDLQNIVCDTLSFDCPVVNISENIWSLELFHGPTLAFKDVGARFMARTLAYFANKDIRRKKETDGENGRSRNVNVLVATSGDTGSAVANGFLNVDGVHVFVLYPKGKVSPIQECQFTTLGHNITALEVDGTFDDCQSLVKEAFADNELNEALRLTSANSINVARFLPQSFYYFNAYARMKEKGLADNLVICVPSGNFGNITAGLLAQRMGLPVKRFIAANNANDVFLQYLKTGVYTPCPSIMTVANAMDVGAPSNFARIIDIFNNSHDEICKTISGCAYSDDEITHAITECYKSYRYILDPHGACGWLALHENLTRGEVGVFLETAHPAKFKNIVERYIGSKVAMPKRLEAFTHGEKQSIQMTAIFADFKHYLLNNAK